MMHSYVGEDRGVFGAVVSDIFGFDDLAQAAADPLSAVNIPLVEKAKSYLKEFAELHKLAQSIQDSGTKKEAFAIIDKKWYPPFNILNPFRSGKWDLKELSAQITPYVSLPHSQFVRFDNNLQISRSRENYLNSFVEGVKELRKFMGRIIALPTQVIDRGSEMLIANARALSAKARVTMSAGDIAAAKAAADSARESALPEGKDDIVREANAISAEMDVLASKTIAPTAGRTMTDPNKGPDMNTILLWGGGALIVIGGIYLLTRK